MTPHRPPQVFPKEGSHGKNIHHIISSNQYTHRHIYAYIERVRVSDKRVELHLKNADIIQYLRHIATTDTVSIYQLSQ